MFWKAARKGGFFRFPASGIHLCVSDTSSLSDNFRLARRFSSSIVTSGVQMWTRMASFVLAVVAVLAVFNEIPIVSSYAFWVLVGAYFLYIAAYKPYRMWVRLVSLVLTLLAIVGVFVEIRIVSDFAFWVMAAAFLLWFSAPVEAWFKAK